MAIKEIIEAYKKMKSEEGEEKKLTPAQKKEIDVDDDGDIDAKDFKKLRKSKKSDEKETEVAIESTSIVDYHREVNSEVAQRYREMLEASTKADRVKGATPPEELDSKMSGKSKGFVAKHSVSGKYDAQDVVGDAVRAGRATKKSPARPGDK